MSLTLIDPAESTPVARALMSGDWDDKTIQRLPLEEPKLGRLLMAVAANPMLGAGREPVGMEQAAVLLGAERLKHATLWHLLVEGLTDSRHRSDAVTFAGHGVAIAQAFGFSNHHAVSMGLASRLGAMLLRCEKPVSRVILRILDSAPADYRGHFETQLFGLDGKERLARLCDERGVPEDLRACITPSQGSAEDRFVKELLSRALADTVETRGEARRPIAELSSILEMRTQPFEVPPPSNPDEMMAAFGELLQAVRERDEDIVALEEELTDTRESLERAMSAGQDDLLPPPETFRRVHLEVARCNRYKRHLSVVAVRVEKIPSPLSEYERLSEVARMISDRIRSTDMLGQIDGDKLLIILPETPLSGARIFAERTEHFIRNTPVDYNGASVPVRAQLYSADLSQEEKPDAKALMMTAITGAESMGPEQRIGWNQTGLRMWRTSAR